MTPDGLKQTTLVVRKGDLPAVELDGETVLLDVDSGAYYGYDTVASRIWELIAEPLTVGELCRALVERYDVDPERCESEVIAFLEELARHGLATIDPLGPEAMP